MNTQDTICAIATAQGGAIGIIRVSGKDALAICDRIFKPLGSNRQPLCQRAPYTIAFGRLEDSNGSAIDEVLASVFIAPHSYTGEDSIELSCHGSTYILQRAMQLLVENGARPAGPGEYTQRAFLNGKMDLSQAEAVADLIASNSAAAHYMAMSQMKVSFSKKLKDLRGKLLHITSLLELELDFSDHEELEFADRSRLCHLAEQTKMAIEELAQSFKLGNAIKNGIPIAIIGETNAGKSTLLNLLVGEEKAIVSTIHGTTRDTIEDVMNIDGTNYRFIDTAGIRDTKDIIEKIGIERSLQKTKQAEAVFLIIDVTDAESQLKEMSNKVLPLCKDKHIFVIFNKTDLVPSFIPSLPSCFPKDTICINMSAKLGKGIDTLHHALTSTFGQILQTDNTVIVSNIRHYNALHAAIKAISRVQKGLQIHLSSDIISLDLRDCLFYLAEITGSEITTDEVLGNIFKHFCIGK